MVSEVVVKEAPVLITVAEAERLCSIPKQVGYQLVKNEWAPFVVRYGARQNIRINREKLLEWANGRQAA